jgi:hypothetical protein
MFYLEVLAFFIFGTDVVFLTRPATSRSQPTTQAGPGRCEVMKGFSRISL